MPIPGSARPTRNQMKNELPFMRPMAPVARPKTKAMKMKVTCSEHAHGPEHRGDGNHCDHDPCDRRHETEHELEQDIRRDDQYRYGEQLSGCIRGQLSHTSIVGGARAPSVGGSAHSGRGPGAAPTT